MKSPAYNWSIKVLVPLAIILLPFYIVHLSRFEYRPIKYFVYYTILIVNLHIVCLYKSYYDLANKNPFEPFTGLAIGVHWIIVFLIYLLIAREMATWKSLGYFFLIAAISVVCAHIVLRVLGYSFSPDSL